MMRNIRRRGFTIVEQMVAVSMIGCMTVTASQVLLQSFRCWRTQQTSLEVERDARVALDAVESALRGAVPESVVIKSLNPAAPPYSRIEFTDARGRAVRIYQTGRDLFIARDGVSARLARDVHALAFAYPETGEAGLLAVALSLEKPALSGNNRGLMLSVQRMRVGSR
jgi:type II secretory pathway pseudopilin PulG